MRIAVPVANGTVSASLALCKGFEFFEDDHGRVTRRFFIEQGNYNLVEINIALYEFDQPLLGA